jgi:hypothetical protein
LREGFDHASGADLPRHRLTLDHFNVPLDHFNVPLDHFNVPLDHFYVRLGHLNLILRTVKATSDYFFPICERMNLTWRTVQDEARSDLSVRPSDKSDRMSDSRD